MCYHLTYMTYFHALQLQRQIFCFVLYRPPWLHPHTKKHVAILRCTQFTCPRNLRARIWFVVILLNGEKVFCTHSVFGKVKGKVCSSNPSLAMWYDCTTLLGRIILCLCIASISQTFVSHPLPLWSPAFSSSHMLVNRHLLDPHNTP